MRLLVARHVARDLANTGVDCFGEHFLEEHLGALFCAQRDLQREARRQHAINEGMRLGRRRFPFAALVSVWLLSAALSFADGRAVVFTATGSDPDGSITSYQWTQTAGTTVTRQPTSTSLRRMLRLMPKS